jgi:hypothetical protein
MVTLDDKMLCNVVQSENEACAIVAAPEEEFDLDSLLFFFEFSKGMYINGKNEANNKRPFTRSN